MNQRKPVALASVQSELAKVQASLALDAKSEPDDDARLKKAMAEESAKRRQRDVGDMISTLRHAEARRIIFRIIEASGCFAPSFVQGQADMTAFNEGQRALGIYIYKLAETAEPGICLRMAREADSDRTDAAARAKKILEGA